MTTPEVCKKEVSVRTFELEPDSELRFSVEDKNEVVTLQLKSGSAEMFGMELRANFKYEFTAATNIAAFTWHGCILEVAGKTEFSYVSSKTPMQFYFNCHIVSENMRAVANNCDIYGPVIMVAGSHGVGKSSLCKMLLNWSVRMHRTPIYVDLDVEHGDLSFPCTVGALKIEQIISVSEGFPGSPLILHFGNKSSRSNSHLFDLVVTHMAGLCFKKMIRNKDIRASGLVINTPSYVSRTDSKLLIHIAQAFKATIVLIIDQERLYDEFMKVKPDNSDIVLVPKSVGVARATEFQQEADLKNSVKKYFYGSRIPLNPHILELKWGELKIYKIMPMTPLSLMPYNLDVIYQKKLMKVYPGRELLNYIMSVTYSEKDENDVGVNVAGFVWVINVDVEHQTIKILCPQPKLPENCTLLLNEIQIVYSSAS